jgi:hypothetical protein
MPENNRPYTVDELAEYTIPFTATRDDLAPTFNAEAYVDGTVKELKLENYRGKWVVLFFYASNFTFV